MAKWWFAPLVACACSLAEATALEDGAARDTAIQWLQLIDAGRNDEAASQGSQEVRSFEQWLNHFKTQRAALGRTINRRVLETKHTAIISGVPEVRRYYILRLKTSFEHKPAAVEEVVLTKIGCCWEIFGYSIAEVMSDR